MEPAGMPAPTYDLICLSHLRWDFVCQRPQHLMRRAARDRRVFFLEEPRFVKQGMPHVALSEPEPNIVRAVPVLPEAAHTQYVALQRRMLEDVMAWYDIQDYALWYYTPMALSFTRHLAPIATIYDCMDDLAGFVSPPPQLPEREAELLNRVDLVFTGGHSLYAAKRELHPHVYPFPSGVEVEHFAQARRYLADPRDQAPIPHPRIGFYGVVDERIDLDLLSAIARLRPDYQFVILGPCAKINAAKLPRAANIHYLGQKEYADLPRYLAGWDAAIMPFARNAATRHISPTKTLEYLAAGKRVVSTAIADVVEPYGAQGIVQIADTPADFVAALDAVLHTYRAGWLAQVDSQLAGASWDAIWSHMQALMASAVAAHTIAPLIAAHPDRQSEPPEHPLPEPSPGMEAGYFLTGGAE